MDFDNPIQGYYWYQGYRKHLVTGETIWDHPEIVKVTYTHYRKKMRWEVIAFFWRGPLDTYKDSSDKWELVAQPTSMEIKEN